MKEKVEIGSCIYCLLVILSITPFFYFVEGWDFMSSFLLSLGVIAGTCILIIILISSFASLSSSTKKKVEELSKKLGAVNVLEKIQCQNCGWEGAKGQSDLLGYDSIADDYFIPFYRYKDPPCGIDLISDALICPHCHKIIQKI